MLPIIASHNGEVLAPKDYEKYSPCFPSPSSPSRLSINEIDVGWYCEDDDHELVYDLIFMIGDSINFTYSNLETKHQTVDLEEGQLYNWQVRSKRQDRDYYSGLYEIRTTTDLELPYHEDFELFTEGDNITKVSTNWRLANGGSDTYRDADITNSMSLGGRGKTLHLNTYSDITLDLDHIEVCAH